MFFNGCPSSDSCEWLAKIGLKDAPSTKKKKKLKYQLSRRNFPDTTTVNFPTKCWRKILARILLFAKIYNVDVMFFQLYQNCQIKSRLNCMVTQICAFVLLSSNWHWNSEDDELEANDVLQLLVKTRKCFRKCWKTNNKDVGLSSSPEGLISMISIFFLIFCLPQAKINLSSFSIHIRVF